MRKKIVAAGLSLCLPIVSGCFNVEQRLKLDRDLSGEVGFSMTMNMEPLALIMLGVQRGMSGEKADQVEHARDKNVPSSRTRTSNRFPPRALIEKSLPAGVKLLDTSITEEGLGMSARFRVSFDHVAKLSQIRVPGVENAGVQGRNPLEHPFPFEIKDEGDTLLLTMETINPLMDPKEETGDLKLPLALQEQVKNAFKDARLAFRLETPLTVVEHNATRKDGQGLLWEYGAETLGKMTPEQLAQGVRVRFRK